METGSPAVIAEGKTHEEMTQKERRAVTKQIKKEIKEVQKEYKKEIKKLKKSSDKDNIEEAQAAKAIDRDLKLAAIFGAVGIVALIISGQVFWIIGGIALIIGVVFFVKWLVRQ
jgi:Flp pilus assembly protein TadB